MIRRAVNRLLLMPTLWHGLHYALPRHPLLWYRQTAAAQIPFFRGWRRYMVIALMFGAVFNVFVLWALSDFPLFLLLPVVGLVIGINTAASISVAIAREHEYGRYLLAGMTPSGKLGASWAIATRFLKRDVLSLRLRYYVDALHVFGLFIVFMLMVFSLLLTLGVLSLQQGTMLPSAFSIENSLNLLLILALLRADYQYSLVNSALIAMIAASFGRNRLESYLAALAGFLMVQAAVYILWLLLGGLASGLLWQALWPCDAVPSTLAALLIYFGVREGWLHLICALLAERLNTTRRQILEVSRLSI